MVLVAISAISANPAEAQAEGVQLTDVDVQGHENNGDRLARQYRGGYRRGYGRGRGGRYRG